MTVCPWCKANTQGNVCHRCGKKAGDHPSVTGRVVGDDFGDDEIVDAPALDLDVSTHRAVAGNTQALGPQGGDRFGDDDASMADTAGLDLDLSAPSGEPPPSSVREKKAERHAAVPPTDAAADALEIDPIEVRVLANYGQDPKGLLETVPYALRVLRRQRELKRSLEGVRAAVKDAEARRDERLIELGTLLRPVLASNPDFAAMAKSAGDAEKAVQDRESALAQTNAAFREKAAAVDADIAALGPDREKAQVEVEGKRKVFDDADLLRKKHEARRKRLEIDVRAAQAKLAAPETSPDDRAQAQALIAAANQERETRATEEKIAVAAAQRAESELAIAKSQLGSLDERIAGLREKRRVLEQEYGRAGQAGSQGIAAASKEMRGVLLEIGRKTWKDGPDAPGADLRRKGIADAMANLRRLQLDHEKHVRALTVADKAAVGKGVALLAGGILLFLALLITWRMTRSNPYLENVTPPTSASPTAVPPPG